MKPTPEEKLERDKTELRELIRAAHEAAQMLKDAAREARAQVDVYLYDEVQKACDQYTREMQAMAEQWHEDVTADRKRHFDRFQEAIDQVATVVQMRLIPEEGDEARAIIGDIVIDLRDGVPKVMAPGTPEAAATLSTATYMLRVGGAARGPGPS